MDLNHLFYEKDTEKDFLSFKKGIKQIESHILNRPHTFPDLRDPSIETIEQNPKKSITFISKEDENFVREHFSVESMIVKDTKNNTLYKIYKLPDNSPHVEQLTCIFKNELYYQLKSWKVMKTKGTTTSDFIVPYLKDFNHFQAYGTIYCVFEMEFIEMTRISDILNPSNAKGLFSKIENTILDLNASKIFHNDLKSDNIGVSNKDHSKIVLIDFGEASGQATNNAKGPSYLFFDRQFSKKTEELFDYNAFVQWATENHRFPLPNDKKEVLQSRSRSRSRSRSPGKSHRSVTSKRRSSPGKSPSRSRSPGKSRSRSRSQSPSKKNKTVREQSSSNNKYLSTL
jgi:tRNA A-37 threonylcarbamoyl transferase component Bud32